jgi:hypothetical protein
VPPRRPTICPEEGGHLRDGEAQLSKQDIESRSSSDEASGTSARPAGAPESLARQLEKEKEARVLMRERLRNTEALAAESHALRERMAQELERVTADRDRLRTAAANTPATDGGAPAPPLPPVEPMMTPHASDWPLGPPAEPVRRGPWRALTMLGGLAAGVAALAWFSGSRPGSLLDDLAASWPPSAASTSAAPQLAAASRPAQGLALAARSAPASAAAPAPAAAPSAAVPLPPLSPGRQLAAAPTAAGPAPVAASAAAPPPAGLAGRLRSALDVEGIAAPVQVDAASGHVLVADPQADRAQRDRTDLVIRSVYAGANLPEPQIEHRWLSPMRVAPPAAATPAHEVADGAAAAAPPRRLASDRRHKAPDQTIVDAEELRPVVPAGRVTAACMAGLPGKTASHRSDLTACMKQGCCSTGNRGTEECRAYARAYPFACSAG